jgi:cellulose biosynthesis protein BcsQ
MLIDQERCRMAKMIALFNHKGGVSKTTTTFNLGWALVKKGYKVLMVDGDPQSNLTSLSLSLPDEEAFEKLYDRVDSNDIYRLIERMSSSGYLQVAKSDSASKIISTSLENLYILPGNLRIEEFSTQVTLALELGRSPQFAPMANIPGFLNYSLRNIADYHEIDFILIDMAPSLSGLNEVLLMGSDFFIAPCTPDFFSEIALKNLSRIIPEWHRQMSEYKKNNKYLSIPILSSPKFLGVIQQNYRPRKTLGSDDKNQPASAFKVWIQRVRDATNNNLVPALNEAGLSITVDHFKKVVKDQAPYDISLISDFNSLIAISQMENKPIFELDESDLRKANYSGAVLQTMTENVEKFRETFQVLAEKIIGLTSLQL